MAYLDDLGALALGSRLKALSDRLYDAVDQVYRAHDSKMQSRWFPLLRLLADRGPLPVGDIAREIGQTHSAVSQLAGKLVRAGWLEAGEDRQDRRRRLLALTDKARSELKALRPLWRAIVEEVDARMHASAGDLGAALASFTAGLDTPPLAAAILDRAQQQAHRALRVVPFAPELREHFYRLNAEWLRRYFYIEELDHHVLSQPERTILEPGGAIFFALLDDEVVGTCALLREAPGVFELTKMAVTERHQGLGIGGALLRAAIDEFRRRRGRELFLESNARLAPALRLYQSMGFELQSSPRPGSHYQRADVYMIWRDPHARRTPAKASTRPPKGRASARARPATRTVAT